MDRIKSEDLSNYLRAIIFNSKNIHQNPFLYTFTDHGINHSNRMLDCINKFIENCNQEEQLNEYECFVLIAAIYLHDIGIQETKVEILENFAQEYGLEFDKNTNKPNFVRNNHHLISTFLINKDINSDQKPLAYVGDPELGRYVALVVKSHGIDFSNDKQTYKKYIYQELYVRVDLISVLLCLADCFDCDKRRIDSKKFTYTELPNISRLHWLKHLYVRGINFHNNTILISYSFPNITDAEKILYQNYFCKETEFWINNIKNNHLSLLNSNGFVFELDREIDSGNDFIYLEKANTEDYIFMEESFCEYIERTEKNIKILKISVGILIHNNCVLMVQRKSPEKDESVASNSILEWQFPAGTIKSTEDPKNTIIKEVLEETGVQCSVKDLLGKRIHPNTKTPCYYYILNYESGDIYNGDENENRLVSWIPIKEYQQRITSDIFLKVENFLNKENIDEK